MTTLSILDRVCILGSRCLQIGRSWSAQGLPQVFVSMLRLTYYGLVLVYLMQSLSYMLCMKKCSMIFSLTSESGFYTG
jgi:hypothetical protein